MPPSGITADLAAIAFLVFLEGVLSLDNALVLALIVKPLQEPWRKRALLWGLGGAIVLRLVALGAANKLLHWEFTRIAGGAYLLYLCADYLQEKRRPERREARRKQSQARSFWMTVLIVELTDLAFAVDSILTAVALSRKLWVVMTGGVLGLLLMRFAATLFVRLLERFPRFEPVAYGLVLLIGIKLLAESALPQLDFQSPANAAFWLFWGGMGLVFLLGFTRRKTR
jgi:YkoY family integral membrane protein